jgi:hypothetical protein
MRLLFLGCLVFTTFPIAYSSSEAGRTMPDQPRNTGEYQEINCEGYGTQERTKTAVGDLEALSHP